MVRNAPRLWHAGAAYLVAVSKALPPLRAAIVAASPSVIFAAAVMLAVFFNVDLPGGDSGGAAGTAILLALPAVLFAVPISVLIRFLDSETRSPFD